MSAAEIIKELPKLTEAERRAVLNKPRELSEQDEDIRAANATADKQAVALDHMEEQSPAYRTVDCARAESIKRRLPTFARV